MKDRLWSTALRIGIFLCLGPAIALAGMILGAGLLLPEKSVGIDPSDVPLFQVVRLTTRFGVIAMPIGVGLIILACMKLARFQRASAGSPM